MNINYSQKDGILEINDGLRTVYLVLKIAMILNILMAFAHLYNSGLKELNFLGFLYLIVGLLSMGVLFYLIFKKSTAERIPIGSINKLREKAFFGKRTFSLELKNGKIRDLTHIKTESEIAQLKRLFLDLGVSSKVL